MNQRKHRSEYWSFLTPKGVEKKMVCVMAGEDERGRLLKKARETARVNNWKLR